MSDEILGQIQRLNDEAESATSVHQALAAIAQAYQVARDGGGLLSRQCAATTALLYNQLARHDPKTFSDLVIDAARSDGRCAIAIVHCLGRLGKALYSGGEYEPA